MSDDSDISSDFSSDDELDWPYKGGFGAKRESEHLPPKEVGPTFDEMMKEREAQQAEVDAGAKGTSEKCRKLMEELAVQVAQYELLKKRNKRARRTENEFKFYAMPKLFVVAPIMEEHVLVDLLEKNKEILALATSIVKKNQKLAEYEKMAPEDFAGVTVE